MKAAEISVLIVLAVASGVYSADWPQLQHDAARTGRTTDQVLPQLRARWLWLGPQNTIRNKLSNAAWTGPKLPPHAVIGDSVTLPASVPFTFSSFVQPVVAGGKVFVADQEGLVYGINADDGTTIWTAANPGGAIASVAYGNGVVITGSLSGKIRLFNATTGSAAGVVVTDGPIAGAPAVSGTVVYLGSMDRHVYCVNLADGSVKWTSPELDGGIAGSVCSDSNAVYVGTESMRFYKLDANTGLVLAGKRVSGQTFHIEWPVVYGGKVYAEAAAIYAVGSEFVGEAVMQGAASADNEQDRWIQFLQGQGGFDGASSDWKHLTVLNTSDFSEPFLVPNGPFEGCGTPPDPPVVDNQNRVLSYFKTKYVTLMRSTAFGTAYSLDISGIDQSTGRRISINNGTPNHDWFTWETDNLYGLTCGGTQLYMRQEFRGTVVVNLANSTSQLVSVTYGDQDGGGFWNADIIWRGASSAGIKPPASAHAQLSGRVGPAISGSSIFFTEDFALVCAEHHQ